MSKYSVQVWPNASGFASGTSAFRLPSPIKEFEAESMEVSGHSPPFYTFYLKSRKTIRVINLGIIIEEIENERA